MRNNFTSSQIDSPHTQYIGRFAPSPSGELHFGSLIAALGSFLDARANQGKWLVRIDDIDPPREIQGAAHSILQTLEHYGLYWDGEVVYQSMRHQRYFEVIDELMLRGEMLYECSCTRKRIQSLGGFYDGFCRRNSLNNLQSFRQSNTAYSLNNRNPHFSTNTHTALRLTQRHPIYTFEDSLQGLFHVETALAEEDMTLIRRDGYFSYNLATVIDDYDTGVTHIVRGADLLSPTTRQISLYQALCWPQPIYTHLPIVLNQDGLKLSKQNHAPALPRSDPRPIILEALRFLGQKTDKLLENWQDLSLNEMLDFAIEHWQLDNIRPKCDHVSIDSTDYA